MSKNKTSMTVREAIADYQRVLAEWREYNDINPHVYEEIRRDADRLVELGGSGYASPWGIVRSLQCLRGEGMSIIRLRKEFALPNDYVALYSRKYLAEAWRRNPRPQRPLFSIRCMIGEFHNRVRAVCGHELREGIPGEQYWFDRLASEYADALWVRSPLHPDREYPGCRPPW